MKKANKKRTALNAVPEVPLYKQVSDSAPDRLRDPAAGQWFLSYVPPLSPHVRTNARESELSFEHMFYSNSSTMPFTFQV